jgi:hypothetical protein
MCIDAQLKAELRKLGQQDSCNLSQYVERQLLRFSPPSKAAAKVPPRTRRPRRGHITIRVGKDLKANLERLAAQDYRTLSDFFELQLHEIVAAYQGPQSARRALLLEEGTSHRAQSLGEAA